MADIKYNKFKSQLFKGGVDLENDDIKVMLVDSSYAPDQDSHEFISDVTGEVSGAGYTAGGASLANKVVSKDDVDNEGVFDADDVVWADSTLTARGAVVYKNTGTPATSPVIVYLDFTEDKTTSNVDFKITWNIEGILNLN